MSPKSINKALDKLGEDYSTRLTQKKQEVSNYLERENELKHQIKEIGTRVVELERTLGANNDFTLHADLVSALQQSQEVLQTLKDSIDKLKKTEKTLERTWLIFCEISMSGCRMQMKVEKKSLTGFLLWELKKQWSVDWGAKSLSAMHTQNRDAWRGYSSS